MEGPFISRVKKGAQNGAYIIPADTETAEEFLRAGEGLVKVIGLAPEENPGFEEYIREVMSPTPEKLAEIENIYIRLFEIYRSYSDVIDCVTTWGVADDYTWLDYFGMRKDGPRIKQYPLLFNVDRSPKACVKTLIEAAE